MVDKLYYSVFASPNQLLVWEGSKKQRLNLDKNQSFIAKLKLLLGENYADDILEAITTTSVICEEYSLRWIYDD